MEEKEKSKKKSTLLILLLLLIIILLCIYIFFSGRKKESAVQGEQREQVQTEVAQGDYVKPEEPVDRSANITLPGWVSFTIPANTKEITQGFEFHNPGENYWYYDTMSIDGTQLEKLVVDSGIQTALSHYLKLANIEEEVAEVTDYDKDCFEIAKDEDGSYTVEAIAGFEGTKSIIVKTDQGREVKISAACGTDCYYMSFGLYLEENDELLYQSGLVSPGKYIQKMEMTRSLKAGSYAAYVVCQPYRSDKVTETNRGVVKITLNVE